jgi:hypothetical protein
MGDVLDGGDDMGQRAWAASALAVLTVQAVRNRTVDSDASHYGATLYLKASYYMQKSLSKAENLKGTSLDSESQMIVIY